MEKYHGHYQVNLVAQQLATESMPGSDFGLKLVAMDHPLNISDQFAAETLILIRIEPSPTFNSTSGTTSRFTDAVSEESESETTEINFAGEQGINGVVTVWNNSSQSTISNIAFPERKYSSQSTILNVALPERKYLSTTSLPEESSITSFDSEIISTTTSEYSTPATFIANIITMTQIQNENVAGLVNLFNVTDAELDVTISDNNGTEIYVPETDTENSTIPEITFYETTTNDTNLHIVTTENSYEPSTTTIEYSSELPTTTENQILVILNETEGFNNSDFSSLTPSAEITVSVFGPQQNFLQLELMESNPISVHPSALFNGQPLRGLKIKAKSLDSNV